MGTGELLENLAYCGGVTCDGLAFRPGEGYWKYSEPFHASAMIHSSPNLNTLDWFSIDCQK